MKKIEILSAVAVIIILSFSTPVGAAPDQLDLANDPGYGDLD